MQPVLSGDWCNIACRRRLNLARLALYGRVNYKHICDGVPLENALSSWALTNAPSSCSASFRSQRFAAFGSAHASASNIGEMVTLSKPAFISGPIREAPETRQAPERTYFEPSILKELIVVLAQHPAGLRRWSVMRAIRDKRNRASQNISLKFEAEVERAFRSSCSNWGDVKCHDPQSALFYRPDGKAGEVWAMNARHAETWLEQTGDAGYRNEQ
jgi:hypothetical protein